MSRRYRTPRRLQHYRVTFTVAGELRASETVVAETGTEAELIVARRNPETVPRFDDKLAVHVEVVDA